MPDFGSPIDVNTANNLISNLNDVYKSSIIDDTVIPVKPGVLNAILQILPDQRSKNYYLSTGNCFVFDINLVKNYFLNPDNTINQDYISATHFIVVQGVHKSDPGDTFSEGSPSIILGVSEPPQNIPGNKISVKIIQPKDVTKLALREHTPLRSTPKLQNRVIEFDGSSEGDDLYLEVTL